VKRTRKRKIEYKKEPKVKKGKYSRSGVRSAMCKSDWESDVLYKEIRK